ncbi:MAG: GtrA family protein [Leptospiraceae bacterium]|nr:GtrA family protein [Leptospiraceae bacterium]
MSAERRATVLIVLRPDDPGDRVWLERFIEECAATHAGWRVCYRLLTPSSVAGSDEWLRHPQWTKKNFALFDQHSGLNPEEDALIVLMSDVDAPARCITAVLDALDEGVDALAISRWNEHEQGALMQRIKNLSLRLLFFFPFRLFFRITDPLSRSFALRGIHVGPGLAALTENLHHVGFAAQVLTFRNNQGERIRTLQISVVPGAKGAPTAVNAGSGLQKVPIGTTGRVRWWRELMQIFWATIRIRRIDQQTRRFVKFGIVGSVGFLVNSISLEIFARVALLDELAAAFQQYAENPVVGVIATRAAWAAACAAELAVISNFLLNNIWTFRHQQIRGFFRVVSQFLKFNLTSIGGVVIQFFVIGAATLFIRDSALVRQLALVFSIIFLIIPYNWTVYNAFIWTRTSAPPEELSDSNV